LGKEWRKERQNLVCIIVHPHGMCYPALFCKGTERRVNLEGRILEIENIEKSLIKTSKILSHLF
jgi:hypothetical protein